MLNANPTSTAATTSVRVRPVSSAAQSAHAAARHRSVNRASGLLKRNIWTATGVNASARAARCAAQSPAHLRTKWCRMRTDATPAIASGTSMLSELNPKIRAESPCTQNAAGGLSTVMKLPGSIEPKKRAFQLVDALLTAAA